jgi:hypothetical protein
VEREVETTRRAWLEAGQPEIGYSAVVQAQDDARLCASQLREKRMGLSSANVGRAYLRIAQFAQGFAQRAGIDEFPACLAGGTMAFGLGTGIGLLLVKSLSADLTVGAVAFALGAVATAVLMYCPGHTLLPSRLAQVEEMRKQFLEEVAKAKEAHNRASQQYTRLLNLYRLKENYEKSIEEQRRLG